MKIKCKYCDIAFDDYQAQCPHCGAPNEGVVRTASKEPKTIEELKQWYESKGLPPAETTRFFIGEDYKKPRAFGIYRDEYTGNVIVYKNKDNGERAIRYQGTDEAYGVNELYQRLKQEIIEQKMNNVKKQNVTSSTPLKAGGLFKLGMVVIGSFIAPMVLLVIVGIGIAIFTPNDGYYNYNNTYYYYSDRGINDKYVFEYDNAKKDWLEPVGKDENPGIFTKKSKCKKYYIGEFWDSDYACSDISDTYAYQEYMAAADTSPGYYSTNSGYYYHHGYNYYTDWYYYDNYDWVAVEQTSLPIELSHASGIDDFYYTSTWDESSQFSDFTESWEYENNYEDSDSDSDYSWSSSDSWDSGSTDFSSDW